ncbi:MAG: conjugal transfer protein TraG N-terminal domain-containing protein [Pseudomonadota bacterium]|nr:conjugal transfer protein TraG N-terminal domain-containing protein [Pseudomonadota bacterium]MDP1904211.1 conjugal transfer protein TraG N-terminal domain-containing protein [Pseudomonadota bacterium]
MDFTIYAYWNTTELAGVFNAVAALTGSGDFLGLLRLLAMIALLSVAIAVLAGRGRMDEMWKWVVMLAVFHGFLLVPKVNVVIVDRTGSAPNQVVANVPIGIASLAGTVSKIGDWLTNSFETVFALPDDVQFRKSGTLFGARVMQEIIAARSGSPILAANVNDFFRECVWPEFATGYVVSTDLIQSPDIWGYLDGRTNPARYVEIRTLGTGIMQMPDTCPNVYTALTAQIATVGTAQAQMMGNILNPTAGTAAIRKALAESQIQTASSLWTNVASSAPNAIRQGMVMNMMLDAQYQIPASLGDTANATTALAETQALRSTSESYKVMAAVGNHTMPKLRNIIEMIQYALAPITLLVVIVLGQYGLKALAMYAKSLLWVQLWPPLYAVVNYIMTMYTQKQTLAMVGGNGVTLASYSYLNNIMVSDQAIAGMIAVVGVPSIAWAMVEGLALGASAFSSSLSSPAGAEAARHGAAAAMGNIKMGELGINNQSMNQYNTAPTETRGFKSIDRNGRGHYTSESGIESLTAMRDQGLTSLNVNESVAQSAQTQATRSEAATLANMTMAAEGITATIGAAAELTRSRGNARRSSSSADITTGTELNNAAQRVTEAQTTFTNESGLKQGKATEIFALAQAGVSVPGIMKLISPLDLEMKAGGKVSTMAQVEEAVKKATSTSSRTNYSQALSRLEKATAGHKFEKSDESGKKAAETIRSGLDKTKRHEKAASLTQQETNTYANIASELRSGTVSLEHDVYPKYLDFIENKHRVSRNTAMDMADNVNGKSVPLDTQKAFIDEQLSEAVARHGSIQPPKNETQEIVNKGQQLVQKQEDVEQAGNANMGAVKNAAAQAGVPTDKEVKDNVSGVVKGANKKHDKGRKKTENETKAAAVPIINKTEKATNPETRPSLLAIAGSNAADAVLPQGTMMLLDKGVDTPLGNLNLVSDDAAFAKQSATSYKGSTMDAAIDTGAFAVTTMFGGAIGRGVGGGIGRLVQGAENKVAQVAAGKATQATQAARAETLAAEQALAKASGKGASRGLAPKNPKLQAELAAKERAIEGKLATTKDAAFKEGERRYVGWKAAGVIGGLVGGDLWGQELADNRSKGAVPGGAGGVVTGQGVNEARQGEAQGQAVQPAAPAAGRAEQPEARAEGQAPAGVPATERGERAAGVQGVGEQPAVPAVERGAVAARAQGEERAEGAVPGGVGGVATSQGVNEARQGEAQGQPVQPAAPGGSGANKSARQEHPPVEYAEYQRLRSELDELRQLVTGGQQSQATNMEPDVSKLLGGGRRLVAQQDQQQGQPDSGQRGEDVPPPARP